MYQIITLKFDLKFATSAFRLSQGEESVPLYRATCICEDFVWKDFWHEANACTNGKMMNGMNAIHEENRRQNVAAAWSRYH